MAKDKDQQARVELIIDGKMATASMRDLEAAARKVKSEMSGMLPGTPEFEQAAKNLGRINAQLNDVRVQAGLTKSSFDKLIDSAKGIFVGTLGANLAEAGVTKLFTAFQNGIQTFKEFESSLKVLKSLTGIDGAGMEFLRESALKTSNQLGVSAKEVVEAYKLMAGAKPELLTNKEALADITKEAIKLSKASGLDLPDASKRLVDALNQFNAPVSEAGRYVNILAEGARLSAAEVPDITNALLEFGTAAKSANVSIGESTAAIETLAEKGLKGSEAGTKLRNVLLVLNAPEVLDKKALNYFEQYGVNLDVLKDKTLPLAERLQELAKIQGDAGAIASVFGKENSIAGEILINNATRVKQLTEALNKDGLNTAQEQATENTKTLANQITRMGNAWDNIMAKQGAIGSFLGMLAQKFTTILIAIDNAGSEVELFFSNVKTIGDKTAQYLIDYGRTTSGKTVQEYLSFFDKISNKDFMKDAEANKEKFVAMMVAEGATVKNATVVFDKYIKNRTDAMIAASKNVNPIAQPGAGGGTPGAGGGTTPQKEKNLKYETKLQEDAIKEWNKQNDAYWKQVVIGLDADIKEAEKYWEKKDALFLKNMQKTWDKTKQFWEDELNARLDYNLITATTDKDKYAAELEKLQVFYAQKIALVQKGSEQEKLLQAQLANDVALLNQQKSAKQLNTAKEVYGQMQNVALSFMDATNQAETNEQRKKDRAYESERQKLKKQLDSKVISQQQYDAKLADLNNKQEAEQKALMRKQAERQKTYAVFDSIIKTALAWVEASLDVTKIPAAIAASIQSALIIATPVPEFFEGGYTGNGGNLDNRGGFAAILHPNEYVVNAKALQDPMVSQMVNAIETGKINNVSTTTTSNNAAAGSNAEIKQLLEHLITNGVHAEMVFTPERLVKLKREQIKQENLDKTLSM